MIDYRESVDGITASQLEGFFVGWPNPPSPATHLRILRQSAHRIVALDSETGQVVGFITAISDGILSAYIPLLEVLPAYQGQGIGRELVQRMLRKLERLYMVDLVCLESLQPFYQKFGLQPASAMVIRNFDRQCGITGTDSVGEEID